MENKLNIMISQLELMKSEIHEMKKEIYEIRKSNTKMDKHIDFVDSIYNKVKYPFHYILDTVNKRIPNLENNRLN